MDRYVDPLVTNLKTMLNYRKFKKGTKAEVDDLLKIEKSENPLRIVYCFGISHEHPGTFILSYIRNTNPHHELISLHPKGFKFRKRMFEDIDRLVGHFQRHIDDLPPDSTQSIRSVAAMVPMRSPANGGSGNTWGGSVANGNDDSWRGHGNSDRERSSTPGFRTGRSDYTGGGRDGHPSGLPRPQGGRGRGRGRGPYHDRGNNRSNEREDSGFGSSNWNSGPKDGNEGWSSFPGAKVQNSPGKEAFPGGSGGGSSWGAGADGWGSGGASAGGNGSDSWGSGGGSGNAWGNDATVGGGDSWGSGGNGGGGDDNSGSHGGRGKGRGRGRGLYHGRGNNRSNGKDAGFDSSNDGLNSFPGAKVQNSPGREAFPGGRSSSGWGSGWGSDSGTAGADGGDTSGGGKWNTKGTDALDPGSDMGNSGWGDSKKSDSSAPAEGANGW
ncbi:Transcription elongation factor spt6 [Thalictrum thalictroides]|uniref:Transcription elongation factor spt6 n=1 Tax=Thalictrum thalictroides TaxID=46969 RepID=A0A7J6VX46_THATH|nr:Transcription elongation factor spt6 [Thalictrum thalictroides]